MKSQNLKQKTIIMILNNEISELKTQIKIHKATINRKDKLIIEVNYNLEKTQKMSSMVQGELMDEIRKLRNIIQELKEENTKYLIDSEMLCNNFIKKVY